VEEPRLITRDAVEDRLRSLVERLPPGTARLDDESDGGGWTLRLVPARLGASLVEVRGVADGSVAWVTLGRDSTIEVQVHGWRPTEHESCVDAIEAICTAVAEGRFTETVWESDAGIVRSRGELQLPAGPLPFSRQHARRPRRDNEVRSSAREFEPYA
jgi:hypothetical protein